MIRWIRDRLGTCAYDQRTPGNYSLIDVRHLVDKGGNSITAVRKCIDDGVTAWRCGTTVVVACDFGVSRSNSIAAGILSIVEDLTLDDAVAAVMAQTGETEIKLDMMQTVRRALSGQITSPSAGNVLVTGGSGFIGRALVPRLSRSHTVLAPGRDVLDLEGGAVNLAAFCGREGVSQIVHLAYPRVYTNVAAMTVGLTMLRAVLDTCKGLSIRLVYVSESVVFGGHASSSLLADELLPLRPKGAYSDAKFLEEMLVDVYARRGDVKRSVCRLSAVYGPGGDRPRIIRTFADAVLSDETVRTHSYLNGRPALDLLFVTDAAEAIARMVEENANDIIHFGSGTLHTTVEIAELIAKTLGKTLKLEELSIDDHVANIQMDTSKAQKLLGWRPAVPLEMGLKKCLIEK